MPLKLVDIHAHLQFSDYADDRTAVIERTQAAGVGVINVGTDLETSRQAIALAELHPVLWATVGIHPTDDETELEQAFVELETLARAKKVVAIGECGLDYGKNPNSQALKPKQIERQKQIFGRQIELARTVKKPLMIHCRNAYQDLYEILKPEAKSQKLKANLHFFAGDWSVAKRFLEIGFSLSFTGVVTFARDYDEVIKKIPLDRLMIETDSPFVAPVPWRGKRNEPLYVAEVAKRVAELKGLDRAAVEEATVANAKRFFSLEF